MRILFLGGNLAFELAEWLKNQGDDVVYTEQKLDLNMVKEHKPDMIISYNYKYLLTSEIIKYSEYGCINLHISLLTRNRGAHPNVWRFLEETPKGVTIHYIDEGIDTGNIIIQKEVFLDENKETLKSAYVILQREIQVLFKENWNKIKNNELTPKPQVGGVSTLKRDPLCLNHSCAKAGILRLDSLRKDITNAGLKLRSLAPNDINDLFDWRNNPDVRKNSFNTNPISWDEHNKWFEMMNKDLNTTNYIACWEGNKIGSIRFENKDIAIKVSVMLNPDFIGKGFGPKVIRLGTKKFINENRPNKPLIAEIKKDNMVSLRAFQKAGYKENYVTYIYDLNENIIWVNL